MGSIIGIIILALDIYAIYTILSGSGDAGKKLLWVILVLFLPILGMILWFAIGRGKTA